MIAVAVTCWHVEAEKRCYMQDGYIQALEKVGLLPLVLSPALSPVASIRALDFVSGLLLSGGDDLAPLHFGQQPVAQMGYVDARRDEQELALFAEARRREMPVFGICRGMQVINAALGGTIIQHLWQNRPDALQHRQNAPRWHRHHHVEIKEGTILATALGAGSIGVNSYHHQALDRLGPGLVVSATSPDGLVEAVEQTNPWLLAVQWHPEVMWQQYPEFIELFRVFALACGGGESEK